MDADAASAFNAGWDRAAQALQALALDENLKRRVATDPVLLPVARRIADRYIAGETLNEALGRIEQINATGHACTADYMGESCRDAGRATAEADKLVALSGALGKRGLDCSLSLDLSHIGSVVDPDLGYANAERIAEATAAAGQGMMISIEGSDRTELILSTHERLCRRFDHVGVTLQARLHRSGQDLAQLLERPGRIRLVKGAYLEPETIAYPRGSTQLHDAFLRHARTLLSSGHACSIATHDRDLLEQVHAYLADRQQVDGTVEFETLLGIGAELLATMKERGYATREYVVFGAEWWLYVCNRLAEEPDRVFAALADAVDPELPHYAGAATPGSSPPWSRRNGG